MLTSSLPRSVSCRMAHSFSHISSQLQIEFREQGFIHHYILYFFICMHKFITNYILRERLAITSLNLFK